MKIKSTRLRLPALLCGLTIIAAVAADPTWYRAIDRQDSVWPPTNWWGDAADGQTWTEAGYYWSGNPTDIWKYRFGYTASYTDDQLPYPDNYESDVTLLVVNGDWGGTYMGQSYHYGISQVAQDESPYDWAYASVSYY